MAKKAAKKVKAVKQSALKNNVAKIKKTATNINKQLVNTVEELVEDAKANGTQVKKAATTSVENFEKIQLKNSFSKIAKTAKTINTQVVETATEIVDEVVENGKMWGATAMKTAKNRIEDIDVKENMNKVKNTATTVNKYTLETADNLVDGTLKNGEKWQGLATKAVKGGLHLAERQQEIVFDTLEEVKGQLVQSATRFRTLFSKS